MVVVVPVEGQHFRNAVVMVVVVPVERQHYRNMVVVVVVVMVVSMEGQCYRNAACGKAIEI